MENASKALIMAGGMLLAILIISLLVYAWSLFSKYQASKDSLADIEDTAKFNEQFANYDRDDVQGYELLSLVNKVIDYNNRKTSAEGAKSNEKYTPMTIVIDMESKTLREKLVQGAYDENQLFTDDMYTISNTSNRFTTTVMERVNEIEKDFGGADCATKIAKSYDSIFSVINSGDSVKLNEAKNKFNLYSTNKKITVIGGADIARALDFYKQPVQQYYEYVQFKKAKFQSQSNMIKYDKVTGRIISMTFDFTGKLN